MTSSPFSAEARAGVRVKICGLTTAEAVAAAVAAGAAYVGFVFVPRSPRTIAPAAAAVLAAMVPAGIARVGLVVDPDDALIDRLAAEVPLDMLQLHGRESPARVAAIRMRAGLPVMKALGIAAAADLAAIAPHAAVADQLLLDAKPPQGAEVPGGHGLPFDWRLVAGRRFPKPWMLAGGLTPGNVAEAVRLTGARQVDVSSGVERAPGVKDATLIRAFLAAALSA
jgi:phosphoribosylanthranilate isomerase